MYGKKSSIQFGKLSTSLFLKIKAIPKLKVIHLRLKLIFSISTRINYIKPLTPTQIMRC